MNSRVPESEAYILGAALIERSCALDLKAWLEPAAYYVDAHRVVHEAIVDLLAVRGEVDVVTVAQRLRERGQLEAAGGPMGIKRLVDTVVVVAHFDYHLGLVQQAHALRNLTNAAIRLAHEPENEALVLEVQHLAKARDEFGTDRYFSVQRDMGKVLDALERREPVGETIRTGLDGLDQALGGLKRGELLTIGARPNGGKTALATYLALHWARAQQRVLLFTTETGAVEFLSERVLPQVARVPAWRLRQRELRDAWPAVTEAAAQLAEDCDLWLCDDPQPTLGSVRRALAHVKPQVLILDHLQRAAKPRAENRTQAYDAFMVGYKTLAREHQVLGVLLAQLSRLMDHEKRRPVMADFRDSGSVESESDQAVLLHAVDDDPTAQVKRFEAIVAKNRHGRLGIVDMVLERQYVEIREAEPGPEPAYVETRKDLL